MRRTVCLLSALLASCTLLTDAGSREIVDQPDVTLRMIGMTPHKLTAVDVALVSQRDGAPSLRGRARIFMPPEPVSADPAVPPPPYPDVTMLLKRAYERDEPMWLLFYADTNDDYELRLPLPGAPTDREHSWKNEVPGSGLVNFKHNTNFVNFVKSDYQAIGRDVTLLPPDLGARGTRANCYQQLFASHVQNELEVRVFYHPKQEDRTQVGLFKTFLGNGLPTVAVRLEGITDTGSEYELEIAADNVVVRRQDTAAADETTGITLPFESWFPAQAPEFEACKALL
jgi:hypothetical protein